MNKLIVALDVSTSDQALRLVDWLSGIAGMFKVGMQLFTAAGPSLVKQIIAKDERVFLDLKFHDIPNTVAAAAVEATRLGVSMFNVHASGGRAMMQGAADAVRECVGREGLSRPIILGVTVLTSANDQTLKDIGLNETSETRVSQLAQLSADSGLDGVVASAREIAVIRSTVSKSPFVIVTPGVRPAGSSVNDQSRVMTPREAIKTGADFIVIGRPILDAKDPVNAARQIAAEINGNAAGTH